MAARKTFAFLLYGDLGGGLFSLFGFRKKK